MKKRSNRKVMADLIKLVKPLIGYMVIAVLMGIAGFLCATFITIFGGYAILNVMGRQEVLSLRTIFVCVVIFALLRGILRYAEQACNHFIAFKLLALIRDRVFGALRRLCPAKLEGKDKGNLISVITSDIELLEVFYAHTISPILIAVGMTIVMTWYIGHFQPLLGLIAFAAYVVVGAVLPCFFSKRNGESGMVFRTKAGELSSYVLESLRGLRESIQYQTGEKRMEQLNCRTDELSEEERHQKQIAGENMAMTQTVILFFDLLMLAAGCVLYLDGAVEFNGVLLGFIALMSSFGPVVALANLGNTLQNTLAAGNRVLDILEEAPVIEEVKGKPEIAFEGAQANHVTFAYGEETILSDVSLEIPKNEIVGISGRSGSGKSTFLKLLMRFWDVQKGQMKISEKSVREINTTNLRKMESFVTQETYLFHDTIENNIRLAKSSATHEEIVEACKKASIHEFIMGLPDGYQSQVGELGSTLSGGERQRIGLARAFLHDAPLILLDEPTSNLDSLNEAVILKSLQEQTKKKTVILVSHRKSTMCIADRIYSMEQGRMS
ncbi:MAG: ABC transporter ATP-binding protein [Lachnospiraceae bacterium]|nr:ABC transporter ATP-binding protein/permease [Robinsoniella sp.]MDY3767427.1 ABC transporter ATP-binding protein [Lachnospiraceae bacterium]